MKTRVKICGLTDIEHVQASVNAGVDAIGLVFYPPSPRAVNIEQAIQLIQHVPPYVQVVALFVNATLEEVQHVIHQVAIDVLQFHGDESPEFCQQVAQVCKKRWYKAIPVKEGINLTAEIQAYQQAGASAVLLDAYHPNLKGGTGLQFDWSLFPTLDIPLILAGGLTSENVQHAIQLTRPYAVDVSGGVERQKGVKDTEKINAFLYNVLQSNHDNGV